MDRALFGIDAGTWHMIGIMGIMVFFGVCALYGYRKDKARKSGK